jgi:hypothetical protein
MNTPNKLQLNGTLLACFDKVEGANWQKIDFLIQTVEQYPREVLVSAWNKTIEQLQRTQIGDALILQINIQSKLSNDKTRYFTEVSAWKIEVDFKTNALQQPSRNPGTIPHPSQVG